MTVEHVVYPMYTANGNKPHFMREVLVSLQVCLERLLQLKQERQATLLPEGEGGAW